MLERSGSSGFALLGSVWNMLTDVAWFWHSRFFAWWNQKTPRDFWLDRLSQCRSYEEYGDAALQLDAVLGNDLWRQNPTSRFYDYRLIYERLQAIVEASEEQDVLSLVNLLRSGLVRNLGNISAPRLFNRAYAGSKLLIEDYITQVALAIEYVTAYPTGQSTESGYTLQAKLDLLHDTRQAFGRSTLVLRGGAIFGLCHLGVVKALHLRGLLPRIITGTGTGALIAALVGIHTEEELLPFLTGQIIDLTAFTTPSRSRSNLTRINGETVRRKYSYLATFTFHMRRLIRTNYFLDVNALESTVRTHVGDLTFEEAYLRTKRVLNITVSTTGTGAGLPNLLNYLTAPNVLIWSAALASNASASPLHPPTTLLCKDHTGAIVPWGPPTTSTPTSTSGYSRIIFNPWTHPPNSIFSSTLATDPETTHRASPLSRIAELFNVNHFIVSHARPSLLPFLSPSHSTSYSTHTSPFSLTSMVTRPLIRLLTMELHHRISQLDSLNLLPLTIRRFLIDDEIPGASLTSVPELGPKDFWRLVLGRGGGRVEQWIERGERSVWPAISLLKVRCAIEVELDRGYQVVRRGKGLGLKNREELPLGSKSTEHHRKRGRASSEGAE